LLPSACKGGDTIRVEQDIVFLVPVLCAHSQRKLLNILKRLVKANLVWVPNCSSVLQVRSDIGDVQLEQSGWIRVLVEISVYYSKLWSCLLEISVICVDQFKVEVNQTPKYLWEYTLSSSDVQWLRFAGFWLQVL